MKEEGKKKGERYNCSGDAGRKLETVRKRRKEGRTRNKDGRDAVGRGEGREDDSKIMERRQKEGKEEK